MARKKSSFVTVEKEKILEVMLRYEFAEKFLPSAVEIAKACGIKQFSLYNYLRKHRKRLKLISKNEK